MIRGLEQQDEDRGCQRHLADSRTENKALPRRENGATAGHLRGPLSLLDRLRRCTDAWAPGSPWDADGARAALWGRPVGSFLVLRVSPPQPVLLCVSTGVGSGAVKEFPIQHTGAVYQLSQSYLGFSDLAQLVVFCSLSRDVLPVRLLIPPWFYTLTAQSSHLSQLGPKDWLCPSSHPKADHMTQKAPDTVMCTIQLTAADGALCVINPLYLHEHGDDWLTHRSPGPQEPTRLATYRRERRLSTTRPWSGASISVKEAVSLEQESFGSSSDSPESSLVQSASCPPTPTGGVVLRRPSRDVAIDLLQSTGTQVHSNPPRPVSDPKPLHSPSPLSPHRVSWIEDNEWLSHPPPPSLLHPPSLELDSLSISSVEEELESANSPVHSPHTSHRLADKVKNRFSAVGQALGGLMSPQKRLTKRVQELSERKGGVFAEALRGFVEMFLGAAFIPGMTGVELLQEVRASLTALRETLLDCPEMHTVIDSLTDTPDWELDAMLELSLHKVALKPVCTHLYNCLRRCRNEDDSLRQLKDNQKVLEGRAVGELDGTPGTGVPDPVTLERIQQKWAAMHRAYSPSKKVRILLKVCKTIYHSMTANARTGVVFGADDFLPCLTWVLLRSDVITLQLDIDYMMELLEPTQLQGEGGYYLTSLYASLFYISSYRPRLATRQLSTEAQNSLRQWHRRRTLHCNQSRRSGNRKTIRRSGRGESSRENCNDAATETDVGSGKDPQPVPSSVVAMALHVISEAVVAVRDEESTSRLESRGSPTTQLQEGEDDAIRTVEQTASQKRGGLWEGGVREENVEEGPV